MAFRLYQLKCTKGYSDLAKKIVSILNPAALSFEVFLNKLPCHCDMLKMRSMVMDLVNQQDISYIDWKELCLKKVHLKLKKYGVSIATDRFAPLEKDEFLVQFCYTKDSKFMHFWLVFEK